MNAVIRLRKIVVLAIGLVPLTFAVLLITAQVEQRLLKSRTDRLLKEFISLQLRQATFQDALRLRTEWSKFALVDGPCTADHCIVEFILGDFQGWEQRLLTFNYKSNIAVPLYLAAGGRPARVRAWLEVRDDRIWAKNFSLSVEVHRNWTYFGPYTLIANTGSQSSFQAWGWLDPQLGLHPNYIIGRPGGCTMCVEVFAKFTPYADPKNIQRLMQINTDCLTSWKSCTTQADILPMAWKQYESESAELQKGVPCTMKTAFLLGRDARNVAIISISDVVQKTENDQNLIRINARLLKPLKRAATWPVGGEQQFTLNSGNYGEPGMAVHKGSEFVLFFSDLPDRNHKLPSEVPLCGLLRMSESNSRAAQDGIAQDFRASDADPN